MTIPVLRPYQFDLADRVYAARAKGARIIIAQAATGAGKTSWACHMAKRAVAKEKKVLFLVHRRRLVNQISERLTDFEINHGLIMAKEKAYGGASVQVASRDTITSRCFTHEWNGLPASDLVIVDECFPSGTLVDGKAIEDLQIGDSVASFNHESGNVEKRRIERTFKSVPSSLMAVSFQSGKRIVCTPGHPFFNSELGCYVPASSLQLGSVVATVTEHGNEHEISKQSRQMLALPKEHRNCRAGALPVSQKWQGLLFRTTQIGVSPQHVFRNYGEDESTRCVGANENAKPNATRGCSSEGVNYASRNGVEAIGARWQREGHDGTRAIAGLGTRVESGEYYDSPRDGKRLSESLQDRCRQYGSQDRYRGGWSQPRCAGSPTTGQKETRVLGIDRVDRIEILKPGHRGDFGGLCPGGKVYNLEVEGNHNYFANGILVHNCHHAADPSSDYRKILNQYPQATILLLSATPVGPDGRGLGPWAQAIECAAPTSQLIRDGYLLPLKCYAPDRKKARGGKYKRGIAGDLVGSWQEYGENLPTVLFCSRVSHSHDAVKAYLKVGIQAVHVDADTTDDERDEAFRSLETGKVKVVSNVGIIREGVDVPCLGCCQLYMDVSGRVGLLQNVGRIMRPFPGQTHGVLIDHAGAVFRHGFPDEDTEWTLEGNADVEFKKKHDDGRTDPVNYCKGCERLFSGSACPQCGKAPTKPPRSIFAAPAVDNTNEILTEADRNGEREVYGREEKIKHWFRCLGVAARKGAAFTMASVIYKQKYQEFPPDDFPCLPPWSDRKRPVVDIYPNFARGKKVMA